MKDNVVKRVVATFLVVAGVLAIVALVAVQNIRRSISSNDWVNHTHDVILQADAILRSLYAGDSALRDFLFTGDARDQSSYRAFYSEMVEHLEVAKAMTRAPDEEVQNRRFGQIETLLSNRVDLARQLVKMREAEGQEGIRKTLAKDPGGEGLRKVEALVKKTKDDLKGLLRSRDQASYLQAQTTRWTVLTGVGLNLLLLGFVAWLIRDDIAARRRAATALEEANAQLEMKVRERTAELAKTNDALRQENLERRWSGKAVEHQLRYSQLIINAISDSVFVISKALNVNRINPAASHWTGLEPQQIISTPLSRVLKPNADGLPGSSLGQDPLALALKEGREIQDCPATLVARGGQPVPARFSLVPLRDHDQVVGGVITVRPDKVINLSDVVELRSV